MRKLSLTAIALYVQLLAAHSQTAATDTGYTSRKLSVSEVNLVSGYYTQNGNHSAVTGGIGTEKLTDISNTVEIKLGRYDRHNRQHTVNFEIGVDHYTSASSDKIDPATISSASYSDTRFYPSVGYTVKNEANGLTIGATGSFSNEYDYTSKGIGFNFAKTSKDNNRELDVKLQAYLDRWKVILPVELRNAGQQEGYEPRNSYSASLSYSQVVNTRFQFSLLADVVAQSGLLGTSYQRVYFTNGSLNYEHLPDQRTKLPLGVRATYFLSDRFIVRSAYRFYTDNWGVKAHTAEVEFPVKLGPTFSISPFYRFYTQTAADYFAPYKEHKVTDTYYTSDFDLSAFNSHFAGTGIRYTPAKGILGWSHWSMLELRYGHYTRSNDLTSDILSLNLRFK